MGQQHGPSWHNPWWEMTTFSEGRHVIVTLSDFYQASLNGEYMSAVGQALDTNDPWSLVPFDGLGVVDAESRRWPFEARMNVLYRLSRGLEPFEMVYRIVT
jgi:hypothetical protein